MDWLQQSLSGPENRLKSSVLVYMSDNIPANLSNWGKSFDLNAVHPKDSHDFLKHGLVAG